MKILKHSKQRQAIVDYLSHTKSHPTADEVYDNVRTDYPNLSLATVYRNLNLLAETGEIRRLSCTAGPEHFDYDTSAHYHFVCRACGRVYDMPRDLVDRVQRAIEGREAPGVIESQDMVFYGICHSCLPNRNN